MTPVRNHLARLPDELLEHLLASCRAPKNFSYTCRKLHKISLSRSFKANWLITQYGLNHALSERHCRQLRTIDSKLIRLLVIKGAHPGANRSWSIRWAAINNDQSLVEYLHGVGADICDMDNYALRHASARGHLVVVQFILSQVPLPIRPREALAIESALRFAALNGHLDVVKLLQQIGHCATNNECLPLREAAANGHEQVVRYFLEETDCDVHANDDDAIRRAAGGGHVGIINLLLEHGADAAARDDAALTEAAGRGHFEAARNLIPASNNVNSCGGSALIAAVRSGVPVVARLLIDNGAVVTDAAVRIALRAADGPMLCELLDIQPGDLGCPFENPQLDTLYQSCLSTLDTRRRLAELSRESAPL